MRLVTYRATPDDSGHLGAIVGDLVVDLEAFGEAVGEPLPGTMLDFIDLGPQAVRQVTAMLGDLADSLPLGTAQPLANVTLLAPIPRTRKNILGIGLNYTEHVAESARALDTSAELPQKPVVFSKPPTCIIATGEPIRHDASMTQQLDWEVELAVIIGTRGTKVALDDAMKHVFGYSVMIDVSARDNRRAGQWIFSKGMDSYAPFGPCIVTADEVEDPHNLDLWLTKNGEEKQRSNTRFMLFRIPDLIADLSTGMTLEPGDVIATGTPPGVGMGFSPPRWLKAGDEVKAGIDGLGEQRHRCVEWAAS